MSSGRVTGTTGRRELVRALGSLADAPSAAVAAAVGFDGIDAADHTEVFAFQAPPLASFYLDATGMLGGEVAARVGGFWEALGYPIPEQPDHLAALLGLYVALGDREEDSDGARRLMLAQARRALWHEHLLPWVGVLTDVVRSLGFPTWTEWADLLDGVLTEQAVEEEGGLSRHLVAAPPPLDDPRDVQALVTPVRSGLVITRADLVRCARASGLGVRLTGRLPTLRMLLDQAAGPTGEWLVQHAREWIERHERRPASPDVASFWTGRAGNTLRILTRELST